MNRLPPIRDRRFVWAPVQSLFGERYGGRRRPGLTGEAAVEPPVQSLFGERHGGLLHGDLPRAGSVGFRPRGVPRARN